MSVSEGRIYAIVDIETTGGYAANSGITEIAIYLHDGHQVIDSYQTLINPHKEIPYHIQMLTGITPEMLTDAPSFEDVAADIYSFLEDKVFVAHNVNFDYSFIYAHLKACGYQWKSSKLCTVRLARNIFKGFSSYSLGNLCQRLDIPISDRHRAAGDAKATVILFERILSQDTDGLIDSFLQTHAKEQLLPTHIDKMVFERLPAKPGIYIFKNNKGKIIYVGKAINIRKRVLSHFTGNNTSNRRQLFLKEIFDIDFEESGTELMALLMECQLIKKHWPAHNRALKQYEPKLGLMTYEDINGYMRLAVTKVTKGISCIRYFERPYDANQMLLKLIQDFDLNPLLCAFYSDKTASTHGRQVESRYMETEDVVQYNDKVTLALDSLAMEKKSYVLIDQGRHAEEKSYIYVKENNLYALGFLDQYHESQQIEDIISKEDRCVSNYYMMQLVEQFAEKNPHKLLLPYLHIS